jgi:hypothetical protein
VAHDPERPCREAEAPIKDDFKGRHYKATLILQAVSHGLLRSIPVTRKGVHTDREQHQTLP